MGGVKSVSTQAKLRALYRIWAGEKIARVARDCGISRQVIYTWKKRAEVALLHALEEKRRGPKIHNSPPENGNGEVKSDVENCSDGFAQSPQQNNTFQENLQNSNPHGKPHACSDDYEKPERCPVCGCGKIYKNGTYVKKLQDNGVKKRHIVQRYICIWCKSSIS